MNCIQRLFDAFVMLLLTSYIVAVPIYTIILMMVWVENYYRMRP